MYKYLNQIAEFQPKKNLQSKIRFSTVNNPWFILSIKNDMSLLNHEVEETNLLTIFEGEIFRAPSPIPRWMEMVKEMDSEETPGILDLADFSQLRARL